MLKPRPFGSLGAQAIKFPTGRLAVRGFTVELHDGEGCSSSSIKMAN